LALIASSLVLATIVAFLAMILTAWPAAAQAPTASPQTASPLHLQLAALPPQAAPARTMMHAAPTPLVAAPAAPRQV
ncbi:hypothetical protein, partial [Stenotrophomonas maltophilia]